MANRKYIVGGKVYEEAGSRKVIVGGKVLEATTSTGGTAAVTGTATASITESDIVTGGKTVIITLTGDTWIAADTGPIGTSAQSLAICQSLDSAQAEATGWDAEVKANFVATDIVRTSDTVATITIGAESGYDITAQETITVGDIANAVLTTSGTDITPSGNTFTVDFVASGFQAAWARNANQIIQVTGL